MIVRSFALNPKNTKIFKQYVWQLAPVYSIKCTFVQRVKTKYLFFLLACECIGRISDRTVSIYSTLKKSGKIFSYSDIAKAHSLDFPSCTDCKSVEIALSSSRLWDSHRSFFTRTFPSSRFIIENSSYRISIFFFMLLGKKTSMLFADLLRGWNKMDNCYSLMCHLVFIVFLYFKINLVTLQIKSAMLCYKTM